MAGFIPALKPDNMLSLDTANPFASSTGLTAVNMCLVSESIKIH